MSKNKLKKWYANAHDSLTLRMVKASSEEEARKKFEEIFGDKDFYFGEKLQHASKTTVKDRKRYAEIGLQAAGVTPESSKRMAETLVNAGLF